LQAAVLSTSLLTCSPTWAAEREMTQSEAQIMQAFDSAVRAPDGLESLSRLPWSDGAAIWKPEILGRLKSCKLAYMGVYGGTLVTGWSEPVDASQQCRSDGYFAQFEMKAGRIKRVTLGETQIVVTSERAN
jgi:hypothetical protein